MDTPKPTNKEPTLGPVPDGRKNNKVLYNLISPYAMHALAELMTDMGKPPPDGQNYKPHDWLKTCSITDLVSACERHLAKIKMGIDREGRHSHATRVLFAGMALTHIMEMKDFSAWDDRDYSLGKPDQYPDEFNRWALDKKD